MRSISPIDYTLIKSLEERKIDIETFKSKTSFMADYNQFRELLIETKSKVTDENENNALRIILWELPKKISIIEMQSVYRELLLVNWHHVHEDIANSFQSRFNNDKDNIPVLLQALKQIPTYITKIDSYPYIRKIIYAIGSQPNPYNIEALNKLSLCEDEKIKEIVLHQIEKRKKMGRWEFEKNRLDGK
jgi:hypothetical protein